MASRNRRRPTPAKQQKISTGLHPLLQRVLDAQARLGKAQRAAKAAQDERRQAVREAFRAGLDTRTLSAQAHVSRSKIYRLITD